MVGCRKKLTLKKIDLDQEPIHSLAIRTLIRNRLGWQKCINATTILLGLKRRKEYSQYRDVLTCIIALVWNTRGTKIWTEPLILV